MIEAPYYPIIYVRGYAGSESEVEDTVATPYMGFNLGATKVRQRADKSVSRRVFESPLIRLIKDHGYIDAYHHGDLASALLRVVLDERRLHRTTFYIVQRRSLSFVNGVKQRPL